MPLLDEQASVTGEAAPFQPTPVPPKPSAAWSHGLELAMAWAHRYRVAVLCTVGALVLASVGLAYRVGGQDAGEQSSIESGSRSGNALRADVVGLDGGPSPLAGSSTESTGEQPTAVSTTVVTDDAVGAALPTLPAAATATSTASVAARPTTTAAPATTVASTTATTAAPTTTTTVAPTTSTAAPTTTTTVAPPTAPPTILNRAPVIADIRSKDTDEGDFVSIAIDVSDPDGDEVLIIASGLPPGVSLTGRTISGRPTSWGSSG